MSFDTIPNGVSAVAEGSQSLSNRAMSFDPNGIANVAEGLESQSLSNRAMSFDKGVCMNDNSRKSLNPFRTGRCLSTEKEHELSH